MPFVRFLVPFVLGITTSIFLPCNFSFSFSAFLVSFASFILAFLFLKRFRYALLNGILLSATLYFFGISLSVFQNELFKEDHFSKINSTGFLIANVDEPYAEKTKSLRFHTKIIGLLDSNNEVKKCTGNLVLYISKDSSTRQLKYGDILLVKKDIIREVPPPQNPGEFDYKRYLHFNNVHYQTFLPRGDVKKLNIKKINSLYSWVYSVQDYFRKTLSEFIVSKKEVAVAQALLYGYDDEIDPDIVQAYANTGTLHVLAVSGMHVGLIFVIIGMMLKFMDKNRKLKFIKNVIIILCLWIYSLLCGMSPSILRATVMFTFIIIGRMLSRPTNIYNTLAISVFCLTCFDTNIIANVGFQLSYMAVIGIVFIQPYVYHWYNASSWLGDEIWKIISVSISAQVSTFPLSLLYFHQFPNYFIFSNLIIIPLTTIIIYAGILLIAVSKITLVAVWIGKLMCWGIWLTDSIVQFTEKIPYSFISGISISVIQALIIFIFLSFLIAYFLQRRTYLFSASLASACIVFMFSDQRFFENRSRKEMVVYNINGFTAVNFIQGQNNLLLADSLLLADKSKMQFHIRQHLWHCGIKEPGVKILGSGSQEVHFNSHVFLISDKLNGGDYRHGEWLILAHSIPGEIIQWPARSLVLSSGLNHLSSQKVRKVFGEQADKIFDVKEKGFFIHSVN
ncbi:MAG: ComEC/Rec2 family competence protein [Bacteroidia bacterium]